MFTVCGTGHRPKYLPCKYDEKHIWAMKVKENLKKWIVDNDPEYIISGMAIGWDTWVAEAALLLEVYLSAYTPFPEQGSKWPAAAKKRYDSILDRASAVLRVSKEYHKDCFFKRDKAMVDNSDIVLALWNPKIKSGGTYWTVKYAESQNKKIINFWESE